MQKQKGQIGAGALVVLGAIAILGLGLVSGGFNIQLGQFSVGGQAGDQAPTGLAAKCEQLGIVSDVCQSQADLNVRTHDLANEETTPRIATDVFAYRRGTNGDTPYDFVNQLETNSQSLATFSGYVAGADYKVIGFNGTAELARFTEGVMDSTQVTVGTDAWSHTGGALVEFRDEASAVTSETVGAEETVTYDSIRFRANATNTVAVPYMVHFEFNGSSASDLDKIESFGDWEKRSCPDGVTSDAESCWFAPEGQVPSISAATTADYEDKKYFLGEFEELEVGPLTYSASGTDPSNDELKVVGHTRGPFQAGDDSIMEGVFDQSDTEVVGGAFVLDTVSIS